MATVYYFGPRNEPGHVLHTPRQRLYHSPPELPFDVTQLDGGVTLPRPEKVGTYQLNHLGDWTVLSWWHREFDRRPGTNGSIIVNARFDTPSAVWLTFAEAFPDLAPQLRDSIALPVSEAPPADDPAPPTPRTGGMK